MLPANITSTGTGQWNRPPFTKQGFCCMIKQPLTQR
jgi:hypothetical protein